MFDRTTIAHELGHALAAYVGDPGWRPLDIQFQKAGPGVGSLATADFHEYPDRDQKTLSPRLSKFYNFSDLGGMFGELLYKGAFHPWGCRGDIDSFLIFNHRSKARAVAELYYWFYLDDTYGFRVTAEWRDLRKRRADSIKEDDLELFLPYMVDVYDEFASHAKANEFRQVVDEIYKEGERGWTINELFPKVCRVLPGVHRENPGLWGVPRGKQDSEQPGG